MANDLKYFQDLAERWRREDITRHNALLAYDRMYHSEWSLPLEIEELRWVRKVISTDPYDAVAAGTRVLSTLMPHIRIQPTFNNEATKDKANNWERNLKWQLKSSNRRRQGGIVRDVVKSALLYDEVIANVIDLDYQIAQKSLFSGNTKREKAARRYGRFMVNTYHPKDVIVRYSNLMPESVLLTQKKDALLIMDEWGVLAKGLEVFREQTDRTVLLYDFMDYDYRCVWVEHGGDGIPILAPEKHDMPFLPWVAMVGGSTMEEEERHKRQPLLYSIYTSGAWDTQNIVKSLYVSEVITRAAAPRYKQEGANQADTEIDYGDPTKIAKVPAGSTLGELRPPEIDRGLAEIDDRIAGSIDKSTVSRILSGGDVPSGTAFATLNLATQTAVGALKPAKDLAEKALAEMFVQMLLWVEYTGNSLDAYGSEKDDLGKPYSIDAEEVDPTALFIDVELVPDVPTDRQQRANTASLLVGSVDYPKEMALEDVGVDDPQQAMNQRRKEILLESMIDNFIRQQQLTTEAQIQMMQQQAQMQMQMQAQQQQEAAMQQQQSAMDQQQGMPGFEQVSGVPGGQANNPQMGGLPPQMANPNVTRENVTGEDITGNPVEEGVL